jgi:hypothetical protein
MAPKFLAWQNLRRDSATFTKQAPHENVAPRNWPDHPHRFLLPRNRHQHTYSVPIRANAIHSRCDKPTGRALILRRSPMISTSSRASFLGSPIAGGCAGWT